MEYRLLGPVEVWDGSELVQLGGAKPRVLLTALLLERNRVVPAERLVDIIWGEDPPETARALVHTHVAGLRRVLARHGATGVIATRPPGYLLCVGPDELDLDVFDQLSTLGRREAAQARYDEAGERFRAALALWRGPALGGVTSPLLDSEAARLAELRLAVLEERVAADLNRRLHEQLVSELTGLVGTHPTRETLRRHLMVALYRSDRQADALAVYLQGRRVLVDELGVEPGPALQAVHEAILRRDADLLGPADAALAPAPATPPTVDDLPPPRHRLPAQLPAVPADFTGRTAQLRELVELLRPAPGGGAMQTVVIAGRGGVGKSTVAVRVAHEVARNYPDGQLYVQLHGMTDTPAAPDAILGRFLAALGDAPASQPTTLEERTERYRSLVAGRRVLVVLDDAAAEAQVRPLLPGSPTCAVLVTARGRLAGLAGAHLIELDVLDAGEAGELLGRIAGHQRVDAEREAAATLVDHCGRLPLAVRIVATRLATRRQWSVRQLTARLVDENQRLDEMRVGDQEVRGSIGLSYRGLDAEARAAVRRLGLLGLSDFPPWVVAALLDVGPAAAERIVERLVDAHFVVFAAGAETGRTRYQMHDLLRIYAAERAAAEDDPGELAEAVRRVLRGWLSLVDQVMADNPSGGISMRQRRPGAAVVPDEPAVADPRSWLEAEQHALVATVERAAALDLSDVAAELASALSAALFATSNMFDAWTRTHEAALAAVRRAGDRADEASLLAELGQLRLEQDRYAEARTYFLQALAGFREVADVRGEAVTLAGLGTACREQGYLPEALHFLDQADAVFRQLDDGDSVASINRLRGAVHLELGDFAAAERELREALAGFRRLGSRRGEGVTQLTISLLHRAQGRYDTAYNRALQSRAIFEELDDERLGAYSTRAMGKALVRLGRCEEARQPLLEALRICRSIGDRFGEALTRRTLGEVHLAAGDLSAAEEQLAAAERLWRALDLPLARARTLRDVTRLHQARGDAAQAERTRAEAMETFRLYGARELTE